jgi:hypothetical protein
VKAGGPLQPARMRLAPVATGTLLLISLLAAAADPAAAQQTRAVVGLVHADALTIERPIRTAPAVLGVHGSRGCLRDATAAALGLTAPWTTVDPHPAGDVREHRGEAAEDEYRIRYDRLALVGGSAAVASFVAMEVQRRRWWQDRSTSFRVMNDWEYVLWADKLGHFFSTSLFARLYTASLRWSGVSERDALLWGTVAGWTQLLYYEILDGFGPQWGFSPGDVLFNTIGAAFTYAQGRMDYLQPFDMKVSYWPSGWEGKNFTDDYAGQTWWITVNPNRALGGRGEAFPGWLNLTVGYGARDRNEMDFLTTPHVYLGVDLELRGLPIDHPLWNEAVEWLRYLHLPAPALRLTPRPMLLLFAF